MPIDRYTVNDALTALAATHSVTLSDDVLNELTHEVGDALDKAQAETETVDDASALSYAIFAINTLTHPDASEPADVDDLERNAPAVLARLVTLRNAASA